MDYILTALIGICCLFAGLVLGGILMGFLVIRAVIRNLR